MIEIVLSVVLAELSYRFIETPIRHGIIGEYLNILKKQTEIQAGEEAPDTGGKKKFKGNVIGYGSWCSFNLVYDICTKEVDSLMP